MRHVEARFRIADLLRVMQSATTGRACTILFLAGLSTAVYPQQSQHERDQIRTGKIKKVTITNVLVDATGQRSLMYTFELSYDRRGSLTESLGTGATGATIRQVYKYNDDGELVGYESGNVKFTRSYLRDDKGQIIEATDRNPNGSVRETREVKRDGNGRVVEEHVYDSWGKLTEKQFSRFNDEGNVVEFTRKNPEGKQVERRVNTYRAKDQATESVLYDEENRVRWKTTYAYDGDRNSERSEFKGDGTLSGKSVFTRDAKGFVIHETVTNETGRTTGVNETKYEFYE